MYPQGSRTARLRPIAFAITIGALVSAGCVPPASSPTSCCGTARVTAAAGGTDESSATLTVSDLGSGLVSPPSPLAATESHQPTLADAKTVLLSVRQYLKGTEPTPGSRSAVIGKLDETVAQLDRLLPASGVPAAPRPTSSLEAARTTLHRTLDLLKKAEIEDAVKIYAANARRKVSEALGDVDKGIVAGSGK